jgi:hypothetical protein
MRASHDVNLLAGIRPYSIAIRCRIPLLALISCSFKQRALESGRDGLICTFQACRQVRFFRIKYGLVSFSVTKKVLPELSNCAQTFADGILMLTGAYIFVYMRSLPCMATSSVYLISCNGA